MTKSLRDRLRVPLGLLQTFCQYEVTLIPPRLGVVRLPRPHPSAPASRAHTRSPH